MMGRRGSVCEYCTECYDGIDERYSLSRERLDDIGVSRYEPDFQVFLLRVDLRSILSSFEEPKCISPLETHPPPSHSSIQLPPPPSLASQFCKFLGSLWPTNSSSCLCFSCPSSATTFLVSTLRLRLKL
jgi:hypothetical protein